MAAIKSHYIPALDGVRALAVLSVIAYHMNPAWAPSGLLGVTMFFVLSGYLITSLLIIEYHNTETINLPAFWLRRIKRLVPAIVLVIACTAALCTAFDHVLLTKLREDVIPSLLFFNNWWQILHQVSYFEALGAPSPLTHFWSLAIEEQFYLVWPVLLLALFKFKAPVKHIKRGVIIGAIASALLMALLFDPNTDPSRVYYGTDTRAFSLLIGAWLAFVWPAWQLHNKQRKDFNKTLGISLDIFGGACLLGIGIIVMTVDGFSPFLYRGGILIVSLLTAGLLAVIVHPASMIGRFLSIKPLNWVGLRSYGIYLWHFPLLLLLNPVGKHPSWWMALLQLALIFAIAEFSYRFIENPIRKGTFHPYLDRFANAANKHLRPLKYTPVCALALVFAVAGTGLAVVPNTAAVNNLDAMKQQQQDVKASKEKAVKKAQKATNKNEKAFDILLIGDSVSLSALPYFEEAFPYGCMDSAIGRQFFEGEEIYDYYNKKNLVGDIVVLALGSNGPITKKELDGFLKKIGSNRKIFLVNTYSGETWQDQLNDMYAKAAEKYDNVSLIDWYNLSQEKENVFEPDNEHLVPNGAEYFTSLIEDAVKNDLPERSAKALEKAKKKQAKEAASENESDPNSDGSNAQEDNADVLADDAVSESDNAVDSEGIDESDGTDDTQDNSADQSTLDAGNGEEIDA